MNGIDRRISDRDALLGALVAGDRWAVAALDRGDDIALLRRITKAGLTDARHLALERAWMRGCEQKDIARAMGITVDGLGPLAAALYAWEEA